MNTALRVRSRDGVIEDAGLAAGGVAPVPLYLRETCRCLRGKRVSPETVEEAIAAAQEEIRPISDIRGSAAYKRLLVRQLMAAHFAKLFPRRISPEDFYAAR